MSRLTEIDFAVGALLGRALATLRRYRSKPGRHRSFGLSTMEWVRLRQVSQGG